MTTNNSYYFHQGWQFLLADAFPIATAIEAWTDQKGHSFYDPNYQEDSTWQKVTLPHTFNDVDLFKDRIRDAGSGQKRTAAFYRNWLEVPAEKLHQKILLEFEGVRQTIYLYVNGQLAGYYEAGVAPVGFDITPWLNEGGKNLIAIATDNTTTRNIPYCIAETPNKPDTIPGSYLFPQDQSLPENSHEGVPFFWNCNDFNPSVGGITRPLKVHFKPKTYLTLPCYSNLQTKGVYVYGSDYDLQKKTATIHVEAEVRNEDLSAKKCQLAVTLYDHLHQPVVNFTSEIISAVATPNLAVPLSITPEDAYEYSEEKGQYLPVEDETKVMPTPLSSVAVTKISAQIPEVPLRFWCLEDPYLYSVEVSLKIQGEIVDQNTIETGFRQVSYDKDQGVLINDIPVWLRGYAQRSTNEWAAIGIPTEWLRDIDAQLIRESEANHIRFMHVAGSPGDIRSYDRQGIVCTQPAGDKERENFGRQWDQRVELMRDVIIYFRNHPAIFFWEAGNNSINKSHMHEMLQLKKELDPHGGRWMGCRTINTEKVLEETEYVGTMLNRHAARFLAEHGPVTETEYAREEAPRRLWDDYTPLEYGFNGRWVGIGGRKQEGLDFYNLTAEDLALANASGYAEFFNDRIKGASRKNLYSACAALCWTDSAQHGRQSFSENGRMSGRVDPVRNKKQSFDVFRVMQTDGPALKIIGHWNYPPIGQDNYRYQTRAFNGEYWQETGEYAYRDPQDKTVYVVASYPVARVALSVNGQLLAESSKPQDTFIFSFPHVDVTQSGKISAIGYDETGKIICQDHIITHGDPAKLQLTLKTGPAGLLADGGDIAYLDIEVLDADGNLCLLADKKIDFQVTGPADFLGGYNSGRFTGHGHNDSVIHKNHVYAECGTNRVFLRSHREAGEIRIIAEMASYSLQTEVRFNSSMTEVSPLNLAGPLHLALDYSEHARLQQPNFLPITSADEVKYVPEKEQYTKMLINGQEPDSRGIRSVNKNGRIWGNILIMLPGIQTALNDSFDYQWLPQEGLLLIQDSGQTIEAQVGRTHLLVNGQDNLMDGEPYLSENKQLVMEVTAILPLIKGVQVQFDDKVGVLRVSTHE